MSFSNPLPPGIRQVVPDYVSDGVTLTWGFPFRLWGAADLFVGVMAPGGSPGPTDDGFRALELGVDYTITITGVTSAIVTLTVPQPAGTFIRLQGLRTPSRTTSVVNDGVVQSAPLESELDVVEATMQELRRDLDGVIAALTTLLALSGIPGSFQQTFIAWFLALPTALPATSGQPWNDGGALAVS